MATTLADEDMAASTENHAAPAPAPAEVSSNREIGDQLEAENLIDTYQAIAEWIRFADAKAAVVLTVGGALAGFIIPTLKDYLSDSTAVHPTGWWSSLVAILFAGWLLTLIAAFVSAFFCVMPFRRKGAHPALDKCAHFHPAAIAHRYGRDQHEEFVSGYRSAVNSGFDRELLAAILIDSHISNAKYERVTTSIRRLAISSAIGLAYLVCIQL